MVSIGLSTRTTKRHISAGQRFVLVLGCIEYMDTTNMLNVRLESFLSFKLKASRCGCFDSLKKTDIQSKQQKVFVSIKAETWFAAIQSPYHLSATSVWRIVAWCTGCTADFVISSLPNPPPLQGIAVNQNSFNRSQKIHSLQKIHRDTTNFANVHPESLLRLK